MRGKLFFSVGLLLLAGCGGEEGKGAPTGAGGESQTSAAFADTSLEGAVRQALKRPVGVLREADLAGLSELEGRGRGIVSLQGIGQLPELTRLDLADNRIEDLAPLASLSKLQFLDLDNNQVRDLSALAGLGQLEVVVLGHNQVQDLTPLLGLSRLKSAELSGNPLSGGVENAQLATLQEKGVEVSFQVGVTPPAGEGNTGNPVFRLAFINTYRFDEGDIFLLQTDGDEPINLTNKPASYSEVSWSPDGTQIAFIGRDDPFIHGYNIFVMNEDGSNLRRLLDRYDSYNYLSWSPDGAQLASVRWTDKGGRMVVVSVNGGEARSLGEGYSYLLAWSPDGERIAFIKPVEDSAAFLFDICTIKVDGSNPVKLVTSIANVIGLSWAPDGRRLIFSQTLIQGGQLEPPDIYLVDVREGAPLNLTNSPGDDWSPAWSPDGTRIAFISDREGNYEIYAMNMDGSGLLNLSRDPGADLYPHWSPDGKFIAYLHYRQYPPQDPNEEVPAALYQVDADGGHKTQLLNWEGVVFYPGQFAWAPR